MQLDDDEYGKVLDSVVVACVDTLVVHRGKVLLGKRTKYPNKSWWFFGGRMKKGDTFHTAAKRGLGRELGLDIAETRCKTLGTYSLEWPKRRESPASNGCHHLLIAMYVFIDDNEASSIVSDNDHDQLRWVGLDEQLPEDASDYLREVIEDLRVAVSVNPLDIPVDLSANPLAQIQ